MPGVIKVKKILCPFFPVFIFLFLVVACNNFQVWEPDRVKQLRIFFLLAAAWTDYFLLALFRINYCRTVKAFLGILLTKPAGSWFQHEIKMFSKFCTVFSPFEIFIQRIIFSLGNLSNPKVIYVYRKLLKAMFFISKSSREQVEVSTHEQGMYIQRPNTVIYGNILSKQFKVNIVTQLTFISADSWTLMTWSYLIQ